MKKVIVTGAATGIGKACAELFRDKGYAVFAVYNNTSCEIEGVNAVKCNLRSTDEIRALFEQVGAVDVLVNNAGVSLVKMINDTTEDDYDAVTSVNERAVYFCSEYAAAGMVKKQSGAIINISSMWGQCGASCETLYSMTKAGVIGLTKALAQELAPSGVTVNCVCPGIVDTRMNAQFDKKELENEVPLGRLGTPEEVAAAVLFFAENSYVTGQILGVNGGIV